MKGITLDAGALIGFDRNDRHAVAIVVRALWSKTPLRKWLRLTAR